MSNLEGDWWNKKKIFKKEDYEWAAYRVGAFLVIGFFGLQAGYAGEVGDEITSPGGDLFLHMFLGLWGWGLGAFFHGVTIKERNKKR